MLLLKLTYNLTDTNINTVIKDINENKSTIVAQRYQLLFIPYTPVYYNKKIVIILKNLYKVMHIALKIKSRDITILWTVMEISLSFKGGVCVLRHTHSCSMFSVQFLSKKRLTGYEKLV